MINMMAYPNTVGVSGDGTGRVEPGGENACIQVGQHRAQQKKAIALLNFE
ncbi:MAG: hypothetical protein GY850_37890 [bacterium]|nr:hypothetical protein [bacterium]